MNVSAPREVAMKRIDNATCDVCAHEHVDVIQVGTSGADVPARIESTAICGACLTGAVLVLARGRSLPAPALPLPPGWNAIDVRDVLGEPVADRALDLAAALRAEHGDRLRMTLQVIQPEPSARFEMGRIAVTRPPLAYTISWTTVETSNDGVPR